MKEKIRKLLKGRSFFAVLVLFTAVAGYGLYKYGIGAEASNGHIHDMSADCGQDSAVTFTEWTETDSLPDTEGSYYLSADVMLPEVWTVPSGKTINLCLNGHQIKLAAPGSDKNWMEKNSIVKLTEKASLNLCDCSADKSGKINGEKKEGIPRHAGIYVNDAEFNMYGGQITGNNGCRMTGPGNSALVCGGGLYVESGKVHLYGGSITENTAEHCGGGIYAVLGSEIVMHSENAVISNNQSVKTNDGSSYGDGGGIYLEESSLCLEQGTISGNSAGNYGGGVHAENNSEIQIKGGTISTNKAPDCGGIYAKEGKALLLSGGNIQENDGGGLFLYNNDITMSGGKISGNTCEGNGSAGAGIKVMSGTFRMTDGEICENSSTNNAGGVYINGGSFIMSKGTISKNTAVRGGGVYIEGRGGSASLSGSAKIQDNNAQIFGGGVCIYDSGSFTVTGGEISGNTCGDRGAGICVNGTCTLSGSPVIKNNTKTNTNKNSDVYLEASRKIEIGGSLGETVSTKPIGITMNKPGIFTNGWTTSMSGQKVEKYFASDDTKYTIGLKDGEGFIGYSLAYVKPEGVSGTVPDTVLYSPNVRVDLNPAENILVKKGYKHVGWRWQEGKTEPVSYVMMSMSKSLYPIFVRNFTAENGRLELKAGESINPVDLNAFVSFEEGVTETEKNFRFEISETSQLPKGLKLENGKISGTLEEAGEAAVTIVVQDLAPNGQSGTFTLTIVIQKQKGRASVSQKNIYCGENPAPVPESATNGTEHVTYYYKPAAAADTEYTAEVPTAAGEYSVRAVFAETGAYEEATAETGFTISHKYGEAWEADKDSHWHVCACGVKKDTGTHKEDKGTVTKKPSVKEPGERTFKCSECSYILRTEEIEKLPKQPGTASVSQKGIHCGESPAPVPESATNGTEHVTYYYKPAAAADTEYTKGAPTAAGEYTVRAVFAETDTYKEVTAEVRFTISHKYGEAWETDEKSHWHSCACGKKEGTENHKEDKGTVTKEPSIKEPGERTFKCSVCDCILRTEEIEKLPKQPGTASVSQKDIHCGEGPVPVPESATNGTEHVTCYYKLAAEADTEYTKEAPTAAGEYSVRAVFAETDIYKEVTTEVRFTISHKYGETWETDENTHWHSCICGEKESIENHKEDKGTVTKEPSVKEPGERTFKCSICGYVLRTEEIPVLNEGNLEKEIQKGEDVPDTRMPASLEELADIVLTQEEREAVKNGAEIKIILTVTDAEKLVSSEEKDVVQAALNGFEKGQYLDISLFKQIDGVQNRIVRTNGKIQIILEIPEHLRGNGENKRTFAIIRVHDGKADWLADLDSDAETITMETDSFSTYVLVYQDDEKPDNNKPDNNKPDDNKPDDNKPDDNKPDNNKPGSNKTNDDKMDNNKGDKVKTDGDTAEKNSDSGIVDTNVIRGEKAPAVEAQERATVKRKGSVKTGDSAQTAFWLTVMVLSGAACPMLYSGIRKRRKRENKEIQ